MATKSTHAEHTSQFNNGWETTYNQPNGHSEHRMDSSIQWEFTERVGAGGEQNSLTD